MTDARTIRVAVVDDHDMVRRGLAAILKITPDLEWVGEASTGTEAVDLCEALHPEVVLMDLVMPEMGGADATRIIHTRFPDIRIIALTSFGERDLVREVLAAGAISYLLKNVSAEDLAKAIRSASAGLSTLAPEAMQALIRPDAAPAGQVYDLTSRELEVLRLMVRGLNNPDIAERLVISRSTAKAHVSNILAKLNVANRAEAIALAIHDHLVS